MKLFITQLASNNRRRYITSKGKSEVIKKIIIEIVLN